MFLFFAGAIASSKVKSGLRFNAERDIAKSDQLMANIVGSNEEIIVPPIVSASDVDPKSSGSDLIDDVSKEVESMESMPCGNPAEICSAVKADGGCIRETMKGLSFRRCVQIAISACIMCLCSRIIPHMSRYQATETLSDNAGFSPIRIQADFTVSDNIGNQEIENRKIFEDQIVPSALDFISRAVKVQRDQQVKVSIPKNVIPSHSCNRIKKRVPSNVDAIAIFQYSWCEEGTILGASICEIDQITNRPLVGIITICRDSLRGLTDDSNPYNAKNLKSALIHEMIHFLGFTNEILPYSTDYKLYTCDLGKNDKPVVKWDLTPGGDHGWVRRHYFRKGIVEAIDARGLKAADCRCPLDPDRTYTDEDVAYCIENPNHCAVAIVTENVKQKTREHFGCETAQGMELEPEKEVRCEIPQYGTHWKSGIDNDELLHPFFSGSFWYLAPYTLAFLEDLGWYKINYGAISELQASASRDMVPPDHIQPLDLPPHSNDTPSNPGCKNLGL